MSVVCVKGIGTAVPPFRIDQSTAARLACVLAAQDEEQARRVTALYRRSGIRSRHFAVLERDADGVADPLGVQHLFRPAAEAGPGAVRGPGTARRMEAYARLAVPLAEQACRQALECAGVAALDITHLVTVSCTGFFAPGVDVGVIRGLGLDPGVERVHVGFMGCQGALNGLRVARALANERPGANVFLCAVELCGVHFQYSGEPDTIVANSLFSDGAAAAVVGRSEGPGVWRLAASGSALLPDSLDAMTWAIGDDGFRMTLSARVPALIEENLAPWLRAWLRGQRVELEAVRSWAVHPGGPRIVSSVEAALGLDSSHTVLSREVLAEHGNMSSPTVLFLLKRLMEADAPRPCVALAFGPGLSVEAALFT